MAQILVVRHGESAWNAEGRWQGQADPPLTELGHSQAREAARALGRVSAVAASDLQRAAVTATVIAEALGVGTVVIDPGWRERDVGEWSGLTRQDIHRHWPGYLHDDPLSGRLRPVDGSVAERRPPGWESDESVLARTLGALLRLVKPMADNETAGEDGGDVVVISHGGVIYNLEHHLGADAGRIPNLAGRWLRAVPNAAAGQGGGLKIDLGERVALVEPGAVAVTVPEER